MLQVEEARPDDAAEEQPEEVAPPDARRGGDVQRVPCAAQAGARVMCPSDLEAGREMPPVFCVVKGRGRAPGRTGEDWPVEAPGRPDWVEHPPLEERHEREEHERVAQHADDRARQRRERLLVGAESVRAARQPAARRGIRRRRHPRRVRTSYCLRVNWIVSAWSKTPKSLHATRRRVTRSLIALP